MRPIFDHHQGEQRIESFTIIVTAANELCRQIHDRMPAVILFPDTWDAWLTATDARAPAALLQPFPSQPDDHVPGQQARRQREER